MRSELHMKRFDNRTVIVSGGARGMGAAIFSRLDVTSDRDWAATVAAAEDAFGPVSVLVNNAGILRYEPIAETEPAAWAPGVGCLGDDTTAWPAKTKPPS